MIKDKVNFIVAEVGVFLQVIFFICFWILTFALYCSLIFFILFPFCFCLLLCLFLEVLQVSEVITMAVRLCIESLLNLFLLHLLLQYEWIDFIIISLLISLLYLILCMQALIYDGFKLWIDIQCIQNVIYIINIVLGLLREHFDQDPGITVEHLWFEWEVEV